MENLGACAISVGLQTHHSTMSPYYKKFYIANDKNSKTDSFAYFQAVQDNEALRSKVKAMEAELEAEKKMYAAMLASTKGELHNAHLDVKRLQEKEARLRSIVLDKAGTQKISDGEIINNFTQLRQRVQTIVSSPIYLVDKLKHSGPSGSHRLDSGSQLYNLWKSGLNLSTKDLSLRMRAELFRLLDMWILNCPLFGLEEDEKSAKVSTAQGKESRRHFMEYGLRMT